jgi:sec-independent protein translocase protein TatC
MEPEDIFSVNFQDGFNKYFPYLLEIRKRLMFIAAIFIVSGFFGFFYYEKIISIILNLLNLTGVNIVFTSPFQFFTLAINSGFLAGLIITFPLILIQFLTFIKPALTNKEYKTIVILLPLTIILFAGGFLYGVGIMKYVVAIFYQKSVELNIGNLLDINLLLSKIILTGVLMGLSFQFPAAMTILMRLKIVKYKDFIKQRLLAYSAAIIFAALLPPTDVISLAFLTIPLVMLFEITLVLNKVLLKTHLL